VDVIASLEAAEKKWGPVEVGGGSAGSPRQAKSPWLDAPADKGVGDGYHDFVMNRKQRRMAARRGKQPLTLRHTTQPDQIAELLSIAVQHHRAGKLGEAESGYRKILEINPNHAASLHLLGVAHYQRTLALKPLAETDTDVGATLGNLLNQAISFYQAGRLADAEAVCRQIFKTYPNDFNARHLLGITHYQRGNYEEAIHEIDLALRVNPNEASAHSNRGNALQGLERLDEALTSYDQAIALKPDYVDAFYNRGTALQRLKRLDEALASYDRVIALKPDYADAFNNRGNVLQELKRLDEALASFDRAIALKPDYAEVFNNRGAALQGLKRLTEALASYDRAIALKPDYADAFNNKANTLRELGKLDEAIVCYEQALHIKPRFAEAHNNLGNALRDQIKLDEAIASYERALHYKPDFAEAYNNLGTAFRDQNKLADAVTQFERSLAIKADYAEAHSNLGATLKAQGQLDSAVRQYQRSLACNPDYIAAHSNLLFCLMYDDRVSIDQLFAAHQEWDVRYGRGMQRPRVYTNDRSAGRRVKVGYVSGDFRQHSVACFVEPLLTAHDRQAVEIFCYAEIKRPDEVTERFKALSDHWRMTVGLSDEAVAAQIMADGIDILVDLAGHTAGNRLPVFARKPAPVQVTWLGYPNSTGLSAIDYRLVDGVTDPEDDARPLASERLVRLDGSFLCYGPPTDAPSSAPPPSLESGTITFGSFNNPTKYSAATIDAWVELLSRIPEARLLLKGLTFTDASTRALYHARFSERGVPLERITLLGGIPDRAAHLAQYRDIDIALDPFPYNGTTTTCEALWMGVPVVTVRGDRHSGRVGASLLTGVGLNELIAHDVEEYIDIAARLAHDRARLVHLRSSLRAQMAASPLCDAPRFARKIEAAYRSMRRLWCEETGVS
jgi:predicted O-linked N-acetylglucosamine transferase (SPINDLY family)